jgi:hypothetical protein
MTVFEAALAWPPAPCDGEEQGSWVVRSHDARAASLVCLLAALSVLPACDGVVQPSGDQGTDSTWIVPRDATQPTVLASHHENCPHVTTSCRIEDEKCICPLDEIGVVSTPDPPTPPPPFPPPPPGWVSVPPSGGSGGGGSGDPCDRFGNCGADAELACPLNVTRGGFGQCTLTIDPPGAEVSVQQWGFKAPGLPAVLDQSAHTSWSGTLLTSGTVWVEFTVSGTEVIQSTELTVLPRTGSGWQWTAGDGITVGSGGLAWQGPPDRPGGVCRPGQPCPEGWIVQPHQNFSDGNGYSRAQVFGGPNQGLWYVTGVTVDVDMRAIVNPAFLPGGTAYPATGSDAQACGADPSSIVLIDFVGYNEECRFDLNHMVPFEAWMWDHETTHMTNAVTYVQQHQYPKWDARAVLEDLVHSSSSGLDDDAKELLEDIPLCVQRAAATHGHLGGILAGFPGTPVTTWWWKASAGSFEENPAGYKTWEGDPGPNPFTTPCF